MVWGILLRLRRQTCAGHNARKPVGTPTTHPVQLAFLHALHRLSWQACCLQWLHFWLRKLSVCEVSSLTLITGMVLAPGCADTARATKALKLLIWTVLPMGAGSQALHSRAWCCARCSKCCTSATDQEGPAMPAARDWARVRLATAAVQWSAAWQGGR